MPGSEVKEGLKRSDLSWTTDGRHGDVVGDVVFMSL